MIKQQPPRNLNEMFPTLIDENQSSDFTLELIYEANSFINDPKILKNVNTIITPDRQAIHLFSNSIEDLQKMGMQHIIYKDFSNELPLSKREQLTKNHEFSIPDKKILILVDSINNGNEISKMVDFIKENDGEIKSIYAYLINKTTLQKMKKHDDYKNILIHGYHVVSKKEYELIHQKFIAFNHSLKNPIDGDHFYVRYVLSPRLTKENTTKMITHIKNNLYDGLSFYSTENKLATDSNLHRRITIEINDTLSSLKKLGISTKFENIASIERLQIRFNVSNEAKKHTHITATIIPILDISMNNDFKSELCKNFIDLCIYDSANMPHSSDVNYHYLTCPQCLENYFATIIFVELNKQINKFLNHTKYRIVGKPISYNPSLIPLEIY